MRTFTESEIAKFVILTIQVRDGEPNKTFIAAAGMDYGYVAAYAIVGAECYAIQYGNDGEAHYALCEEADNLPAWIESHDADWLVNVIQRANVRGADYVPAASEDDTGPFYVLVTRRYLGRLEQRINSGGDNEAYLKHEPHQITDIIRDNSGLPVEFATMFDAQARILTDGVRALYVTDEVYKIISKHSCSLNLG